jgi:hypothetical protein
MGKKGDFKYAYNGQINVDKDNQIIVGQHITQNANDKQELKPALQEIKETTGELPGVMSCDNGYLSGDNLAAIDETEIDVYIATGKGEKNEEKSPEECDRGIKKSEFTYDTERDCFLCPCGHILELRNKTSDGKNIYQAKSDDCVCCPRQGRCCTSKKGEPRTITTDDQESLRQAMVDKMTQEASKKIYKERKIIVEPVFGQIKECLGFRGFSVRGLRRVMGEFSLVCAVHNIKKIVNSIRREILSLNEGALFPLTV